MKTPSNIAVTRKWVGTFKAVHRQTLRLPANGSVPLKRYNFLRINSRNQPFIYLQSLDNFKFDYEKDLIE